jgi:hypothetical protein
VRTLAELRTDVLAALGFIDPFTSPPTMTLANLTIRIKDALGIPDGFGSAQTKTLTQLKTDLFTRLGYGTQTSSLPPGMDTLATQWINAAQDTIFRRIELDLGGISYPTPMASGSDGCTMDATGIQMLALAMAKAHQNDPDAKVYFEQFERWIADEAARRPPHIDYRIKSALVSAQQTAYRRYEMASGSTFTLAAFNENSDSTTIDAQPVYLLAMAQLAAFLKRDDAKLYLEQYERYMAELEKRMPANARGMVAQLLKSAHRTLYRRYKVLRLERFFTWTLVSGQNMYELNENDEQNPGPSQCLDVIDPRSITWAGIERDGIWYPLIAGIPPECYSNNVYSNMPARYEIRQCIELWPAPGDETQYLRLKGHAELPAFEADADEPGIDDEALYLLACAEAKQFYKQPDAQIYVGKLEAFMANVTAGRHQTRRYLPGQESRASYVQPQPLVPWP